MKIRHFPFLVILFLTSFCLSAAIGAWDVSPGQSLYEHSPGETFTVNVQLGGSGNDIDALGFDFQYPSNLLQFNSADFSGTLLNSWMFKDVSELSAGTLRVAGFTTTGVIPPGASGVLVKLSFTVKSGASGEGQLSIGGFTDDLTGSTTSPATFRVRFGESVMVSIPDTFATPLQVVELPVIIEDDVTGKGIIALMVVVKTNTSILTPIDVSFTGTLLESWGTVQFNIQGGDVTISGADINELVGSGPLAYIQYQVSSNAPVGQTSVIDLFSVLFNEGDPYATLDDGLLTIIRGYIVSGNVNYYQGNKPIGNVSVELGGSQSQTDNNGSFTIEDVPGGNWALKPEKDGDLENSISPFDAAKVLQYSVGILTLTPYQMIAADVSGNGSVSPFDASYILQYTVGTLTEFPVGDDWKFIPSDFVVNESNWSSAPDSIYYEPLISDLTGQDFTGIVYGDVTGNWLEMTPQASASDVEFTIDAPENIAGGKVNIPIRIKVTGEAYSGQLYLEFDNSQLIYLSCSNQANMSNIVIASEENEGQIILAFASPLSIGGNELRLNLQFDLLHPESSMTQGLNLTEIKIDDKVMLPTVVNNLKETAIPNRFELYQNHPNPFNPETTIQFQLPKSGQVKIDIFNQLGQKVKTLLNEQKPAGTFEVRWNGVDDKGQPVVSGVYFYKMTAGKFTAIKKMALIR